MTQKRLVLRATLGRNPILRKTLPRQSSGKGEDRAGAGGPIVRIGSRYGGIVGTQPPPPSTDLAAAAVLSHRVLPRDQETQQGHRVAATTEAQLAADAARHRQEQARDTICVQPVRCAGAVVQRAASRL